MKDTSEIVSKKYRDMLMQRTPEERIAMTYSMFESGKEIIRSSIRDHYPEISDSEMKKELFLRFYGQDFSEKQRKKIIKHLISNS